MSELDDDLSGKALWASFKAQPFASLFILALFLSIPFGAIMAFYTGNTSWLYFCIPIFIFLS